LGLGLELMIKTVDKEIFRLAIPNILSNVTIPLLGIVDTVLMGHEAEHGAILIGAIALGGIIFNAIYWNFGFLRLGTTGITAQAFGRGDKEEQALTLFRAFSVGLFIAIVLLLFRGIISDLGFSLLRTPENTQAIEYAKSYFDIRILAVPAVMCLFGIRGWLFGVQNAVFPMILITVVNVVNVLASVYFVRVQGMSVEGVALGTVVAQYCTLILGLSMIFIKYGKIFSYLKLKLILARKALSRFVNVNGTLLIRNMLLFSVFSFFTWYSSTINENYFAVNEMLLQLFYLMSFAVDGFAYAAESLVGKYVGAKDWKGLKNSVRRTMVYGLGFGVLYAIVYVFFGKYFLRIFTPDWQLIESGQPFLFWLAILSVVGAVAFIWDGVYGGATLVRELVISMALSTLAFFVSFYIFKQINADHAIWASMTVFMAVRGIGQWVLFDRFAKKL